MRTIAAVCLSLALLSGCAANQAPQTWRDCTVTGPCAEPFKAKVVIVTMFERGEVEGDSPGEFQLWKERRDLDTVVPFPHGYRDVYVNEETGIVGFVTGIGTMHSAGTTMALGLDPRFDLSEAYWLVAGIAGIDPEDASIGSVAWSSYLIDGDLGHQIDAREKPDDWPTGYFARRTHGPLDTKRPDSQGERLVANPALRDWAFELTKDVELPDLPGLAETRSLYTEHPNAQRPPFVLTGGHIAAMTFWHGELLNDWANDWVRFWSDGETDFVTSAMEETGTFQSITYLHEIGRVDKNRFMVLRAGSNYTMPPPGVTAADNLLAENEGYAGFGAALESLYVTGSVVIDELLANWGTYQDTIPSAQ